MISIPPTGDADKRVGAYFAPLEVLSQEIPDMTVRIRGGGFWNANKEYTEFGGGSTIALTAPGTLVKWVVITLDENGAIVLYDGVASANPQLPSIPTTVLPLAAVYLADTTTEVTSSLVFDLRPLFMVSSEQVEDLQQELDDRPTFADVNLLLNGKADVDGTPNLSFKLNKSHVGVPLSTVSLMVERGTLDDVGIRYNEPTNIWEFTNDGTTWIAMGAFAGPVPAHAHVAADVTDFNTNVDSRVASTSVGIHADVTLGALADKESLVWDVGTSQFINYTLTPADVGFTPGDYALVVHTHATSDVVGLDGVLAGKAALSHTHPVSELTDFSSSSPLSKHVFVYNGGTLLYENRYLNTGDISDFVNGDFVHTTGDETVAGEKTFTDLTIHQDKIKIEQLGSWDFNVGEIDVSSDPGLQVDRSYIAEPNGVFYWDEASDQWMIGMVGSVGAVATAASLSGFAPLSHFHTKADVIDFAESDYVHTTGDEFVGGNKTFTDDITIDTPVPGWILDIGEVGASSDAGFTVDRTFAAAVSAVLYWDEASELWMAGTIGNVFPLLSSGSLSDYYTKMESNALFAPIVHTHLKSDITDFVEGDYVHTNAGVGSPIPSETIFGEKVFEDSITVGDINVVDRLVTLNYGETGAGVGGVSPGDAGLDIDRGTLDNGLLYWNEVSDTWQAGVVGMVADISLVGHNHVSTDINDFTARVTTELGLNNLDTIQDVTYTTGPTSRNFLLYASGSPSGYWEPASFGTEVTTELNVNSIDELSDVDAPSPDLNDVLFWEGSPNTWRPRLIVKADVSDFVESDYIQTNPPGSPQIQSLAGSLNISDSLVVTGDLTVNGTETIINTVTLEVTDNKIVINDGETGAGVTAGTAGLEVDRGTLPRAFMEWDEVNDWWRCGATGDVIEISRVGHQHVVSDITDLTVTAAEINQLNGINLGPTGEVQVQLDGKQPLDAFLTSIATLGTVADRILYTTAVDTAAETPLTSYMRTLLDDVDASTARGTLGLVIGTDVQAWDSDLDDISALAHTGGEVIYSSGATWASAIPGVTSGVQAYDAFLTSIGTLGTVADRLVYTTGVDTAAETPLTAYMRTVLDDGDAATAAATLSVYSKSESDGAFGNVGAKIDKIIGPPVVGNIPSITAAGELIDGGVLLSAVALTADHYTKVENDGVATAIDSGAKINKVFGGTVGNVVEQTAGGELTDSGFLAADVLTVNTTGEIAHTLGDLANVTDAASTNDLLVKTAGDWQNLAPSSYTYFVHTQGSVAESITGDKTFSDDVIINGDMTVNGPISSLSSTQVDIGDPVILLNATITTGPPTVDGGIEIARGSVLSDNAQMLFNETTDVWEAGIASNMNPVALESVTPSQPDYELFAEVGVGPYVATFSVPVPAAGKRALQVFVNGIKQIEETVPAAGDKQYHVNSHGPVSITFDVAPPVGADIEIYGFGTIG